jgi:hypothetical protein
VSLGGAIAVEPCDATWNDPPMAAPTFRGLRLPPNSRVPDASPGSATLSDYDEYFSIDRGDIDLREWTTDCLSAEQALLRDLPGTDLNEQEQAQILAGLVILHRTTLEQWARAARDPSPA